MYIQITNRCNMECYHCCNAVNKEDEMDMPFSTFKMVLDKWGEHLHRLDHRIIFGGGEPTLHPDFWKMISYASLYSLPWLATNGKLTDDALVLCDLSKQGKVWVTLSLDVWHEPISEDVIKSFSTGLVKRKNSLGMIDKFYNKGRDKRSIYDATNVLYKAGRSKVGSMGCHCRNYRVYPDGLIVGCSCLSAPVVGTVENGISEKFKNLPIVGSCSRNWKISDNGYYYVLKVKEK